MPEIGATLREARMRSRIDITEIEAQTKIRAKYLRALENEEWELLPGPTYVKTFLRTYGDALGLDGKLLVDEYKLRHERLSDIELQPISPRSRVEARPPSRGIPRGWLVAFIVIAFIVSLALIGRSAEDTPPGTESAAPLSTGTTPVTATAPDGEEAEDTPVRPRRPRRVRLQLVPSAPVYVCLRAADGRTIIGGQILQPGQATDTFRSQRFRLRLGNSSVQLRVNGRPRAVQPSAEPIGYEITQRNGAQRIPLDRAPDCS